MTLEQRDRFRLIAAAVLLVTIGLVTLVRVRLCPLAERLMRTQVDNQASTVVYESIQEQLEGGGIDYDRIITIEKDVNGNVTAMRANVAEVNGLRTKILESMDRKLLDLSVEELSVPVGSVVLP